LHSNIWQLDINNNYIIGITINTNNIKEID